LTSDHCFDPGHRIERASVRRGMKLVPLPAQKQNMVEVFFEILCENVKDNGVNTFDKLILALCGLDQYLRVRERVQTSAVESCDPDDGNLVLTGEFHGPDNIL
jgi:hypothetical protein